MVEWVALGFAAPAVFSLGFLVGLYFAEGSRIRRETHVEAVLGEAYPDIQDCASENERPTLPSIPCAAQSVGEGEDAHE